MADENNKSEKATPYKLQEARKKGQVSKSTEVVSLLMLLSFVLVFYVKSQQSLADIGQLFASLLSSAGQINLNLNNLHHFSFSLFFNVIGILTPFILVLVLAAILANILQTGPILTWQPIKPDWQKLNPVSGAKKLFSRKTLFELFKALLKISTMFAAFWFLGEQWLDKLLHTSSQLVSQVADSWWQLFLQMMLLLLCIMLPLALIDLAFAKWDFAKRMMMSKQDVKDEHKKKEGDPQVRSKQKQLQKEMLQKAASLSSVKDADIIITNPQHLAIALQYNPAKMPAPKVLAMGADHFAAKIRKVARQHNIPLRNNKPLARKLFKQAQTGGYVPESCYDDLAPVFRWLLGMDNNGDH